MSVGTFEYKKYRIDDIADIIRLEIAKCRKVHKYKN